MKIAHIFSNYKIGGAQTLLIDIMNCQCIKNDVTLFIITNVYEQHLLDKLDKSIKVVKLNRKVGSINYVPYVKLNLMINLGGYDVVHTHENHIEKKLLLFSKIGRYHTIHTTAEYAMNTYFRKFDGIFCISQSVYEAAVKFFGSNKNLIMAKNGIIPQQIEVRIPQKPSGGKILIGCISRLIHSIKGQDIIIEALHILKKRQSLPSELVLEFIGDGPSMSVLQQMVTKYELEKHVFFLGAKDRDFIYRRLKHYDFVIQPSRFEGFALTVVEALAANVPVLVSNNQGPYEIIDKGKYGEWFINGDAEDLAKKILITISNYDLIITKTSEGHKIAIDKYNIKRTAQIYIDGYNRKR